MTGGWAAAVAVVAVSGLLLQGCGYQFGVEGPGPRIGGGAAMMEDEMPAVRLAVRHFGNRTFHRHLEDIYTRFMRQEFAVGSGARVVADDAGAEYVMTGEIVSAKVSSLTFSTSETRERRVEVTVSATVTPPGDERRGVDGARHRHRRLFCESRARRRQPPG